jgi:glycolate oxidase FAD binding subunit
MSDTIIRDWQERIRAAAAARQPLAIRGGGSKDFYGEAIRGEPLDTTGLTGIVDYDPTELVITARAGTPLAEIEHVMGEARQMLAFEPPHFGPGATLGGAVAAGLSGPRRPYAGAVRDVVLGVRVLDGLGRDLSFGGRVMKNVAGFDVARLMAGAMGTLGVLLEISLKCQPCPKSVATRVLDCDADEALRRVNAWSGKPLSLSATCHAAGRLFVRLAGAAPAVAAAAARIGGTPLAEGDAIFRGVRDHTHPFFAAAGSPTRSLWRVSVKPTAPFANLGGEQLIEWGGALRWVDADRGLDAARIRGWAESHGGHATLFRAADKTAGAFHPLPEALWRLHQGLKANFDPAGILNPGRLYPGL